MLIASGSGAPLHAAVIGVSDLQVSCRVYAEGIGFEAMAEGLWQGEAFERHFALAAGSRAAYVVLADRGGAVGRILLLQFQPAATRVIRGIPDGRGYGLMNLNFYAENIHDATRRLEALGCTPWTKPVEHRVDAATGSPVEVMLDGPDGVILNLVELGTADPTTRIGRMRSFVQEESGYTSKGLTPVVTTQHSVQDLDSASRFYEAACGMSVFFDTTLDAPSQNLFHRFEPDTCSDVRFMIGDHPFGKIALIQPLNHRFTDLAIRAAPPAIGYLAQAFVVADAERAAAAAAGCGADQFSPVVEIDVPGLGASRACIVRSPGSGALIELIELIERNP